MKLIQVLFYVILAMVLIPILTIYLFDISAESGQHLANSLSIELQLTNRLIELSDRLKHSQMLSTDRKRDISQLKNDINQLRETIKMNLINANLDRLSQVNETNIKALFDTLRNTGNRSEQWH